MQLEKVALKGATDIELVSLLVGTPVTRDRRKKLSVGIYDREPGSLDSLIRTYRLAGKQKKTGVINRAALSEYEKNLDSLSSSCVSEDHQTAIRNSSAISSPIAPSIFLPAFDQKLNERVIFLIIWSD